MISLAACSARVAAPWSSFAVAVRQALLENAEQASALAEMGAQLAAERERSACLTARALKHSACLTAGVGCLRRAPRASPGAPAPAPLPAASWANPAACCARRTPAASWAGHARRRPCGAQARAHTAEAEADQQLAGARGERDACLEAVRRADALLARLAGDSPL
jgi:hypothetical protein